MPRLLLSVVALLVLFGGRTEADAAAARPNIVVILGDDRGFSDIGCYGGEIQTQNLDALAKRGVRFTQFYNRARGGPTGASRRRGLYPHQAGGGHRRGDGGQDSYGGDWNQGGVTMGEALRRGGYGNYAVGKGHVTGQVAPRPRK